MRFTSETSSNGVVERSFTTGEVTGLLWLPAAVTDPRPLVLMGHGGGQDKRARGVVSRAHHFVTTCGFAVAAIDAPGHGDRPVTPADEQHITDLRQAQVAGDAVPAIVRYNTFLAERAVPEWQAILDALQALPEIGRDGPVGYWGVALGTAIGVRLAAVEPRIVAAVFGLLGPESLVDTAARVTVPVQFLAQSDEPDDPHTGSGLFDAFASTDKTLISNPASHYRGRPFELDSSTRFFLHHLGRTTPATRAVAHVAARSEGPPLEPALRVTLNFHPDRLCGGLLVLDAMARDGCYRSQFETGTSNGGLTAHPGGDRWSWESRLFGGAYDDAPAAQRPKYGALDFRRRGTGGSPRFGSAHLRLRAQTLERTTFCYPDSVLEPTLFGVAARMSLVGHAERDDQDRLDDYIEAQVHGPVRIAHDVEALVLDPCFRGTDVERAAARMPCPVEWHGGFRLAVDELRRHPDYRGQEYVDLGCALARDGYLDPAVIGDAARSGHHDEQALKRVWHHVARFGG